MDPEGVQMALLPCPFCTWTTRMLKRPAGDEPPGSLLLHL